MNSPNRSRCIAAERSGANLAKRAGLSQRRQAEREYNQIQMSLSTKLRMVLRSAQTERPVARWLKQNPLVLARAIARGQIRYLCAEFAFGTDYRSDFVFLDPFSGGWDVHFVELEPPGAKLFTKSGAPARRLRDAIAQIDAWRTFVEKRRDGVLPELSKFMQNRELLWGKSDSEPIDNCGWPLYHPQSSLVWHYQIIIGRLNNLDEEEIAKKAGFRVHHNIEILTYDRLVRTAENMDRANEKGRIG